MKLKTALLLSHRWLGVGVCLLIAMWFATGMVMMYVAFPQLTEQERYAGLPILNPELIKYSSAELLASVPPGVPLEHLKLTSVAKRPVYLLKLKGHPWRGIYADTGESLIDVSAESAVATAVNFYQTQHSRQGVKGNYLRTMEMDQWTASSWRSVHKLLHLVSIDDLARTHLYVSSRTGQVIRDTTHRERVWNWLGANLHWIYPLQLRKHTNLWVNIIIALCLIGLITIITGGIIGFLRLRIKRPYGNKSFTPYRGVPKVHHVLGLISLIFLTTFLFSGLMSMSPWGLFNARSSFTEQVHRYQLSDDLLRSAPVYSKTDDIQRLLRRNESFATKEILWHWIGGESHVTLHSSEQQPQHWPGMERSMALERKIHQGVASLIPDAEILAQDRLEEYDSYYYSHHDRWRPLPILRVKFSDQESTWFHIDLSTGEVLRRLTYKDRVARWLFNGLHSLDFAVLINNRPIWDLLLLSLCSLGLAFSVTSVVMGWRRLRKHVEDLPDSF